MVSGSRVGGPSLGTATPKSALVPLVRRLARRPRLNLGHTREANKKAAYD